MTLLAIFSAIGLIDSLLNLVVELDLLHSFALLQQLGDGSNRRILPDQLEYLLCHGRGHRRAEVPTG